MTTYYVDPANGDNGNSGEVLDDAFADFGPVESGGSHPLGPGDTVELRDTAVLSLASKPVWWQTTGTAAAPITVEAHGDERPVIDCSNYDDHGIDLWGVQHMIWRGIEVRNVGMNAIRCVGTDSQAARDCTFEDLELHHYGTASRWNGNGLVFYGRSHDHTVRGVVCHHGADDGDSDGFYVGGSSDAGRSGGHTFVRCEAHHNADDGFDFFDADPDRPSTLTGCLAHHNGTDGVGAVGDGTGFKLGGGWGTGGTTVERCLAWENRACGFDTNGASVRVEFRHCTAWSNGTYGFHFTGDDVHVARNCAAFENGTAAVGSLRNVDTAHNSWDLGIDAPSFVTTDEADPEFLRPTADSPLVDAGTGVDSVAAEPITIDPGDDSAAAVASHAEPAANGAGDGQFSWADPADPADGTERDEHPTTADTRDDVAVGAGSVDGEDAGRDDVDGADEPDPGNGSGTAETTSPTPLEEFADGSLSEYTGDTGTFSVTSTRRFAGTRYLESSGSGAVWHTGLETTVGDTYEVRVRQPAETFAQVLLCVDEMSNGKADVSGYGVEMDFGWSTELSIVRYDDGSARTLASAECDPHPEQWNRVTFSVDGDGRISATALAEDGTEFASVSTTDTTYTGGKLGFGTDNPGVGFDGLQKR